ncbi:hypothetical protein DCS_08144 [Drechmeria coniospora]|uniref:Uncharacterized protein n=1 Tax=Drechmeria coniospora TaxID=98403 RepID=A0A151GGE5_DRECN|nr:hypothetical protein DCS_08144 [Drechmeria coniospora]KYK56177.1 hypothetical protein DCS_08144 [Drechmeria coniospora]
MPWKQAHSSTVVARSQAHAVSMHRNGHRGGGGGVGAEEDADAGSLAVAPRRRERMSSATDACATKIGGNEP